MICDHEEEHSALSDRKPRSTHSACILYLFHGHNKDDFGLSGLFFIHAGKPFNPAIQPRQ